jgi:hypothetical protein
MPMVETTQSDGPRDRAVSEIMTANKGLRTMLLDVP